jgi:hypothetical protein
MYSTEVGKDPEAPVLGMSYRAGYRLVILGMDPVARRLVRASAPRIGTLPLATFSRWKILSLANIGA